VDRAGGREWIPAAYASRDPIDLIIPYACVISSENRYPLFGIMIQP